MQTLNINPLFRDALRPLDPDEYERLSRSIESEGCHTALMTWNGFIIAGHNRYQICRETGQSFKVENRDNDFANETDVLIWILDDALAGRNLDFGDKKRYIGELYNLTKQRDEERAERLQDTFVLQGDTSENIGSKFGVSGRTVRRYGSEQERQKLLKALSEEVQRKAQNEGWIEDEERMNDALNEASESLQPDEDETFDDSVNDFNQDEPTQEQKEQKKANTPKRNTSKSKGVLSLQKAALRTYESALNKVQGLRLDLMFDGSVMQPDYKAIFESIETARSLFPVEKKRFGK